MSRERPAVPVSPTGHPDRRRFLELSGLTLGWLALGCDGRDIVAARPPAPGDPIPVVPTDDMAIDTELDGAVGVRSGDGELLAYVGEGSIYLWPAGGSRPGPRFIATASNIGMSGSYGFQIDRPAGSSAPLDVIFSIDGRRTWEIGLDMFDDASGQGRGPDFVLAYDSSDPPGDRFRMAPGGYTLHSPSAGSPAVSHRFHVVSGNEQIDRAVNVLYLQSGSWDNPGSASWLIRGQGYNPDEGNWGREIFGVGADGTVVCKQVFANVTGGSERDLVILETAGDGERGWLSWRRGAEAWRMGFAGAENQLGVLFRDDQLFAFAPDGTVYADSGFSTFSPAPPRPAAEMTARDWCDWAYEDASKPVKPYDGVPTASHPAVLKKARTSRRPAAELAEAEQRAYGKDVSKIAIGTAHWAEKVQSALERADSFDEFKRILGES